ncbi:ATP-grasp domain-containing protein [Actinoplanes sp. NPDC049118]|uniref:ATP-grasp domain-containing protein n=1 Tax=Actinoplanes sp. NPDC049118 TaxID=3155769 RepID=UPI0033DBE851
MGSGDAYFRRYSLEDLASEYDVWLLAARPPVWEREYVAGWAVKDFGDAGALAEFVGRLPSGARPDGILSWVETLVGLSCTVAARLGLPGTDPAAIDLSRDKLDVRERLAAAGLPQPGFGGASTAADALRLLDDIGYPAVLKPRRLAGSCGVLRVDAAEDVTRRFEAVAGAEFFGVANPESDRVLVEELLVGDEISVDSACRDGVVTPLIVARKRSSPPPYFEELAHTVSATDPLLESTELRDLLQRIHDALGLDNLMTHIELRLTAAGLRLIEVNPRLGGGMIPYLGGLATGVSLPRVAAGIAVGEMPDLTPRAARVAHVELLYPDRDLVLESVEVDHRDLPEEVHSLVITKKSGDILRLPPEGNSNMCRYGYLITLGQTPEVCRAAAAKARESISVTGHPLSLEMVKTQL